MKPFFIYLGILLNISSLQSYRPYRNTLLQAQNSINLPLGLLSCIQDEEIEETPVKIDSEPLQIYIFGYDAKGNYIDITRQVLRSNR